MTAISGTMPLWLDILICAMVLLGAGLTLIGNIGLIRLKDFYDRVHAPTLGATLGAGFILIAAIVHFMAADSKLVLIPVLIAVFMTMTTPVTLIMLTRAALYRDRVEKRKGVPQDT